MNHSIDFAKLEESIHDIWERENAFETSNKLAEDRKEYVFYDGPPFATGLPHYGHILSGTIKDTVTRFYYMQGFKVKRRFGWDCHGLPVEYEIDKALGITGVKDIHDMGIRKYNKECRKIVLRYTKEWEAVVKRMGRWIDFRNGYRTMDRSFMESIWYIFKMLYEKGSVYRGHRVMPYSTACSTPLSNFEANQNYKDVSDPSILVAFPLRKPFKGYSLSLVAWTTTPWTLPSHMAILVNQSFIYAIFRLKSAFFIMQRDRVNVYFKDAVVISEVKGHELLHLEYDQPFMYYDHYREKGFFRVYHADFVSEIDGTGVVHCSPGFGEDDYKAMTMLGLIKENELLPSPLDENGRFNEEVPEYKGMHVKDADKSIIKDLGKKILYEGKVYHRYPFCWRSDTPLIYKLVPNWFVRVKREIPRLLESNSTINWIPESIGEHKFKNWLSEARDWSISRNRFWGTPIPLWHCDGKYICIGSIEELSRLSGRKIDDIHRENVDDVVICKDGEKYRRIEEVFDCWFESGCMPYAQRHWPFECDNLCLPADFVAEGVDQTRGWFYTMHVISTVLFGKASFRNCIVNGIVLASDKKKMSKRLKNYPDPMDVINRYSADSLRLYLISSPVVMAENMCFSEEGVGEVLKTLLIPWYNCIYFYSECPNAGDQEQTRMDDWILNTLNTFGNKVKRDMSKYMLQGVMGYATSFVNDLSNWYIRMNRKTLKSGASSVLKDTLVQFAIMMAPFTPFFSEYTYQKLAEKSSTEFKSVHFEMFPRLRDVKRHSFDDAKKVIEAVRRMREAKGISLKTPLKEAKVICNEQMRTTVLEYGDVIKNECFLMTISLPSSSEYAFKTSFRPNFAEIRKCGDKEKIKLKISLINRLPQDVLAQLVEAEKIVRDSGVEVTKSEVLHRREIICDGYCASFDDFYVILDTEMTSELEETKAAREFFSFLQRLRKKSGLKISDSVLVYVSARSLVECVSKHYNLRFCSVQRENPKARDVFWYNSSEVDVCLYLENR